MVIPMQMQVNLSCHHSTGNVFKVIGLVLLFPCLDHRALLMARASPVNSDRIKIIAMKMDRRNLIDPSVESQLG